MATKKISELKPIPPDEYSGHVVGVDIARPGSKDKSAIVIANVDRSFSIGFDIAKEMLEDGCRSFHPTRRHPMRPLYLDPVYFPEEWGIPFQLVECIIDVDHNDGHSIIITSEGSDCLCR